jgi:hypothetical protein
MRNCSYCKSNPEEKSGEGLKDPGYGCTSEPFLIIKQGIKFCDS